MKTPRTTYLLSCLLATLFFASCENIVGTSSKPNLEFETISSQQETLLQIQTSPTNFSLPIEQNEAAWARARFFLQQYAGSGKIKDEKYADKDTMTKIGSSGFRYQMVRQFEKGTVNFQVFCTPKDNKRTTAQALLNAKNVARFVREGELEVSQLVGAS